MPCAKCQSELRPAAVLYRPKERRYTEIMPSLPYAEGRSHSFQTFIVECLVPWTWSGRLNTFLSILSYTCEAPTLYQCRRSAAMF